jgi:hypothetical protein
VVGGAGAGGGGDAVEQDATTHAARASRPTRTPADRNGETTS